MDEPNGRGPRDVSESLLRFNDDGSRVQVAALQGARALIDAFDCGNNVLHARLLIVILHAGNATERIIGARMVLG